MLHKVDLTVGALVLTAVIISASVFILPGWLRYVLQMALAASLAALGVMILLRAGLLSLGQGLYYFVGAYTVPLLGRHVGISDAIFAILLAGILAAVVASIMGLFIARYRGIFFAMLTLALSMVAYGIAIKVGFFGGSDGLNVNRMTFFGFQPRGADLGMTIFFVCIWTACLCGIVAHLFLRSRLGKVIEAIEDNEVRLEYLGQSVRSAVHIAYVVSAIFAGIGGALAAISARHVDPSFAYWTTGGDFVFIVLLSGQASVMSPFFGAIVLEILRVYASALFPDQWQMALGAIMLIIVLFLPAGVFSVFSLVCGGVNRISGGVLGLSGRKIAP